MNISEESTYDTGVLLYGKIKGGIILHGYDTNIILMILIF